MELDFSKLENMPVNSPTDERNEEKNITTPKNQENATQGDFEGLQSIKLNREQTNYQRTLAIYKEYQENIRRSSTLQTEILKGLKAGESIYSLFLKAMEAIGRMTNIDLLHKQAEEDIKAVYGLGLLEREPLEIERQTVAERLERLQEAEGRAGEPDDSRVRISAAVKAHQQRIEHIDELIKKAEKR